MKVVVKIGGVALDDPIIRRKCATAVAHLVEDGHKVAVVHGGGITLTRMMERLGRKTEFIDGFRVTDAETRDVAVMVLAGMVNKKLVATIAAAGLAAVGLCGGDGKAFRARKKFVNGRDLGFVGEIASADSHWVEAIWSQGGVPVMAPVTLGADSEYYNVNADEMASACAIACRANALIFLTDVPGVKNAEGSVIPWLNTTQIDELISSTVISGGMLPKLEACRRALQRGVGRVRILPAAQVEVLPEFYFTKVEHGTEVLVA